MHDISRSITIDAQLSAVWDAIVDSSAFGAWFGAEFSGPFALGRTTAGEIVPTTVDPEVAASQEPHRGAPLALEIIAVEPMSRFAFRWQPVADSPVRTTVQFLLAAEPGGVHVTVTEDGFDQLPDDTRASAREGNDGGWKAQTRLLATYLARDE